MEQMHSSEDVQVEVADILRLVEGSPGFQQLINRELMGMEVETGKRSRDSDSTPPPPKKGIHPHKFDPIDRETAEKNFRDWVEKYM